MINAGLSTLKRIFSEKSYWLCCICIFALCFTASVDTASNGDPLNVFGFVFGDEKNLPAAERILDYRGGAWLFMFMPIISALCFVNTICDSKSSRFIRYEIFRTGYYRFKAAEFISSAFSSGICTLTGFAAFSVFVKLYFPSDEFYKINLALVLLEMFIYGIVSAAPALITAVFTNNKYLIACVPFLLKYCVTQLSQQIILDAIAYPNNFGAEFMKFASIINPDSLSSVFSYQDNLGIILINAFVLSGGFAVYLLKKGGVDKGE